ncbi:MAG: phosphatase PAP2 family protein [Deltaproteobacteria bacterium]|nr:phosphatase PAP2 family protein [Deltaproteobacteria bacterium]MDQ3299883.1 phosphatase PAP2 family protein [Myxococcota bacterium]
MKAAVRANVVAVAVLIALIAAFAGLASNVLEAETDTIDHAILMALRSADGTNPIGPAWLERGIVNLSALGSTSVTVLIIVLASVFLLLDRRPRQAMLVIATTASAGFILLLLKTSIGRERPSIVKHIDIAGGLSFPSGHTLLAAVLYPTLGMLIASNLRGRHLKIFVFAVAALLALVVGLTRVYIGVHYPTDVLGGWCLGVAVSIGAGLAIGKLKKEGIVERPKGETSGEEVGPIP